MGVEVEPVERSSENFNAKRLEVLKEEFPEIWSEGKIDFTKLRETLGDFVDESPERYAFSWAGKRDAIQILQVPTMATLVPSIEESINFENTKNIFIEGDNLEVLKLLYKSYYKKIKMIYIDPPFNTGGDFIYPDNFRDPLKPYLKLIGDMDEEGYLLTSNPETSGRFHSSWLSMMYPRLFIARQLLTDDGVICISIDDVEVANLKLILNEIFGEENFIAHIVWQKRYVSNVTAKHISDMHDHILVYSKNKDEVIVNKLRRSKEQLKAYKNPDNDPRGDWRAQDLSASKPYSAGLFEIITPSGRKVRPPPGRYWRCNKEQYEKWVKDNRIWFGIDGKGRPMKKAFLSESQEGITPNTWWDYKFAGHNKEATLELKDIFDGLTLFDTPKPVKLIKKMIELFGNKDSITLDFFAGSCTTAHSILEMNHEDNGKRKFIMVQLPEKIFESKEIGKNALKLGLNNVADIGKERIRRIIKQLYDENQSKLIEKDEDLGFRVFKLSESNYKQWEGLKEYNLEIYLKKLEEYLETLQDNWKEYDLIFEVALKEGYPLTLKIKELDEITSNKLYKIYEEESYFYICLDKKIKQKTINELSIYKDTLFICVDSALNDEQAANLALQCTLKTI